MHEPRRTDTLTIGVRADNFVSRPERSQLGLYPLSLNICEPLVRLAPDFTVQPLLATSWEYRGKNTWRFHLRPNVRFTNGVPFTSEAVQWTIEVAARREPHTYLYADSVKIVDPLTVDLTPRQTNFRLVEQLVHPSYGMLAPGSEPSRGPIGTGPFKFDGYQRDEWIAATRNDHYWGEKAKLRRIVFRFLPDDTTRVLSIESGAVDMITDVPRTQLGRLAADRTIRVVTAPIGRVASLFLNRQRLHDVRIRRAIAYAIDRDALIRSVLVDGKRVATIGPPDMLGSFQSEVHGIPYDPRKAVQLLRGRTLDLTLIAWPEFDLPVLEFLQGQLAAVGIHVRILRFPDQPSYDAVLNRGAFDLDLEAGSQNDGDPIFLPALRFYSKSPVVPTPFFAIGPKFDAIVRAGLTATERAVVQRESAEAQHMVVDDDVAAIPLAGLGRTYALRQNVRGFDPHPSQLNQLWSGISRSAAAIR